MTLGSQLVLDKLVEAKSALTTYQQQVDDAQQADDPLTKLNKLLTALGHYQDYIAALEKSYILNVIDPHGTFPAFRTQLDALQNSDIAAGFIILQSSSCNTGNPATAYTLDCLTALPFVDAQNNPLAIAPIINRALKARIIAEVGQKVGFPYNGKDANGTALPTTTGTAWDDESVSARTLFEGVPFQYDRVGAATCAINTSRRNFETTFPYGSATLNNCTISGLSVPQGVGSNITYSFLKHVGAGSGGCSQSTGSALFISEAIFRGGHLPMVSENASNFNCGSLINSDWLICKPTPGATAFESTYPWRDHFGLIEYFTGISSARVQQDSLNPQVPIGHPPPDTDGLQSFMYFFSSVPNGKWRSTATQTGPEYLYNLFRTNAGLAELETGDYVFHYLGQGVSSHGFIIVGWGDAVEADMGLNANQNGSQTISLVRPRDATTDKPQDAIPYVADFCYGYSNGDVGWLQDPRPRPFYASMAQISNAQLEAVKGRLGYSQNFPDYSARLQANTYGRFSPDTNPYNGIPVGWLFFHIPSTIQKPFLHLLSAPIKGVC